MKKLLSLAAITVAGVCATATAFADEGYTTPVGVSLRIGGFYPSESDTRNNVGDSWIALGIDFKINGLQTSYLPAGYFSVSLDYAGRGDYRTAPVLANYTTKGSLYGSVGAGVTFGRFPQDDGIINDKIRFAYSGAVGYNFSNGQVPLFLELRYLGCEMPRLGGTEVYLGARF